MIKFEFFKEIVAIASVVTVLVEAIKFNVKKFFSTKKKDGTMMKPHYLPQILFVVNVVSSAGITLCVNFEFPRVILMIVSVWAVSTLFGATILKSVNSLVEKIVGSKDG